MLMGNMGLYRNGATFGQRPILNQLSVQPARSFSLRLMNENYTGSAIRVIRSLDNTQTNIGFNSSGSLDIVSLLSFAGNGSAFITVVYDQMGSGVNPNQTIPANQPRIVNNGVLDLVNSLPTFFSTTTTTSLNGTLVINGSSMITLNIVGSSPYTGTLGDSGVPNYIAWSESGSWGQVFVGTNQTQIGWRFGTGQIGNFRTANSAFGSGNNIVSLVKTNNIETPYRNGVALTPFTSALNNIANTGSDFRLMSSNGTVKQSIVGLTMQEVNIFLTALSASDRVLLERNQGAYYGITVS